MESLYLTQVLLLPLQGVLTVDRMDDAEEMRATDEAYDILGTKAES